MPTELYAHGKLLLTAEYAVLRGAKALALPLKLGQKLTYRKSVTNQSEWKSLDDQGNPWFEASFGSNTFEIKSSTDQKVAEKLHQLILFIRQQNANFLKDPFLIETHLEFNRSFGLGTSSTLVSLLAQLSETDPYPINKEVFGSSGYDIACATAVSPISYRLSSEEKVIENVQIPNILCESAFFVYLGKKQNSREAILKWQSHIPSKTEIFEFTRLTNEILQVTDFSTLENLINKHEDLVSKLIEQPKVKDLYFKNYWSSIKSLGAWGGDFVMALSNQSNEKTKNFFQSKGFEVVYSYDELILNESANFANN